MEECQYTTEEIVAQMSRRIAYQQRRRKGEEREREIS